MDETIVFGDIETAVIAHLGTQFTARSETATVAGEDYDPHSTSKRPDRLVVVKRIGGPRMNLVTDAATIDFHCYAATWAAASTLANLTRGIVNALPGVTISGLVVNRVTEYSGPARLPNPVSKTPRYVFVARVEYRGAAA